MRPGPLRVQVHKLLAARGARLLPREDYGAVIDLDVEPCGLRAP